MGWADINLVHTFVSSPGWFVLTLMIPWLHISIEFELEYWQQKQYLLILKVRRNDLNQCLSLSEDTGFLGVADSHGIYETGWQTDMLPWPSNPPDSSHLSICFASALSSLPLYLSLCLCCVHVNQTSICRDAIPLAFPPFAPATCM